MNLENINTSYLILSYDNQEALSILDSMSYNVLPIQSYSNKKYDKSYFIHSDIDNNIFRRDILFILERTGCKFFIIKYKGESTPKKIFKDGSERLLEVNTYSTSNDTTYLYKGMSFSFSESKRYWVPRKKEDFRCGMVVEYFNNNKWNEKVVENPGDEWNKMYNLLLKYNKLRVLSKN